MNQDKCIRAAIAHERTLKKSRLNPLVARFRRELFEVGPSPLKNQRAERKTGAFLFNLQPAVFFRRQFHLHVPKHSAA